MSAVLEMPAIVHDRVLQHLLNPHSSNEEAAFLFVHHQAHTTGSRLRFADWYPVPPDGFAVQLPYHFELTDETRASMIKRAHDSGTSVIEFHSHRGPWTPQFSPSDWSGFEELLPHVWWRLKGRPYGAVVVSRLGFDGFVWLGHPSVPERIIGIDVEGSLLEPSRLSPLNRDDYDWTI